jgi:cytochrome c553
MSGSGSQDSNKSGMRFLIVGMSLTLLLFIYVIVFHPHLSPDDVARLPKEQKIANPNEPAQTVPSNEEAWISTPAKLEKGKQLFSQTCAMCHNEKDMGDGIAGANLNPKPRNFTQNDGWKNGNFPFGIFKTLKEGIPGSSMAPYAAFSFR